MTQPLHDTAFHQSTDSRHAQPPHGSLDTRNSPDDVTHAPIQLLHNQYLERPHPHHHQSTDKNITQSLIAQDSSTIDLTALINGVQPHGSTAAVHQQTGPDELLAPAVIDLPWSTGSGSNTRAVDHYAPGQLPALEAAYLPWQGAAGSKDALLGDAAALPQGVDLEQEQRQRRQVIASSIIGNLLEWYDFLVFAYQSVIISKLFFPKSDTYTRYLSVYGIFAAGFVTRPLGALFFGWLGDKYSRKTALLASIYLMSAPTVLMGCLPTYHTVGRLGPWLLVLTRLAQGFAVGGEFTATMVFLVEHAPRGQAGLQGSWAFFSVMIGVLCGSGVSMLFNYALSDDQLYAWGWRVPFLLSAAGAAVGVYMRRHVHEPPKDTHHNHQQHHNHHTDQQHHNHHNQLEHEHGHLNGKQALHIEGMSLLQCIPEESQSQHLPGTNGQLSSSPRKFQQREQWMQQWRQAVVAWLAEPAGRAALGAVTVFMMDFLTAVGFYLVVIFLPIYFQEFVGLSRRQAMSIHTMNMVLYMLLIPLGGLLSDRVGHLPLIWAPGLVMAVLAYPLWELLSTRGSVMAALEGQALLCVIMALFNGGLPATFVALFHPQHRCTGVSLGHNLSMAACGGTAPLIATALMKQTGSHMAPAGMLIIAGILTSAGGAMARWLFEIR